MSTVTNAGGPEQARLLTRPFVIVTATALVFFIYIGMLIPIVPLFIEGPLGRGEFGIGLMIAVFAGAAIIARPVLGRLADRYGRRVLLVGGSLVAGLAGIASSQVTEFWQLLVMRSVMGIGEAAVFVGAATLIADLSPRDRRAEGASYFSVAVFGGIGLGPVIGEFVLDDTRFEQAFAVAGAFALAAAVVALFAPARVAPLDAVDDTIASAAPASGRRRIMHPAAVMPGVVLASGVAAFSTFGAFIPDYSRQVGLATSGGLFAAYSLTSVLVRIFGATLPERLGPRRAVTIALGTLGIGLSGPGGRADGGGAVGRVGVRRHRDGVQLPVAARAHRQPGERQRPGVGDQLVHDVLRGRLGVRRVVHRRIRAGGRQADRLLRRRAVLPDRAVPVALQAGAGRHRPMPAPRTGPRCRTPRSPATDRTEPAIDHVRVAFPATRPIRNCDANDGGDSRWPISARVSSRVPRHDGHVPPLDPDQCYVAVQSRDRRFDGWFVTAVRTTGIYCRPSCPAITPKRTNVDFYPTAAAAQQQRGFRACKRCRPDASPGSPEWNVRQDVVARAMRLIADGAVEREGVAGLAATAGLQRAAPHIGCSPTSSAPARSPSRGRSGPTLPGCSWRRRR